MRAKPTVLLVEDDPSQLADYAAKLEGAGCRVLSAVTAEDAISLTQNHRVDIILTDNVLPGMSGLRSISEFAKRSDAPVLVMTSHFSVEVEHDALLLGAKFCLKKPLDFALLGRELRRALAEADAVETPSKPQTPIPDPLM